VSVAGYKDYFSAGVKVRAVLFDWNPLDPISTNVVFVSLKQKECR